VQACVRLHLTSGVDTRRDKHGVRAGPLSVFPVRYGECCNTLRVMNGEWVATDFNVRLPKQVLETCV
jgi:hypothetical protein